MSCSFAQARLRGSHRARAAAPSCCGAVRGGADSASPAAVPLWRAARLAACGALAAAALCPPSVAISENQLLFLEAWRAVDKAYVDKTFNGVSWFRYRESAVKKTEMDTKKQTYDAIRAMLATLARALLVAAAAPPLTLSTERPLHALPGARPAGGAAGRNLRGVDGRGAGDCAGRGLRRGASPLVSRPCTDNSPPSQLVVAPASGGPAERAGLRPGDQLLSIDGVTVGKSVSIYEAASLLQGPDGSVVSLTYRPAGVARSSAAASVTLRREPITLRAVTWSVCAGPAEPRVGYLRVSSFSGTTPGLVREALEAQAAGGAQAIVLDLRNNGGGFFPAAVDVARLVLPKSTVVYIADSAGVRDVFDAPGTPVLPTDTPLAVLVNKGTASAAEVLAGALRDNGRAHLLGEQTFGKGIIQTTVALSDGSAVNVTLAKYQTPSGADINKVGLRPDGPSPLPDAPATAQGFCDALAAAPSDARAALFR